MTPPATADAPIAVFYGADRLLPELLREYARMCQAHGATVDYLELVENSLQAVQTWQNNNRTVLPWWADAMEVMW